MQTINYIDSEDKTRMIKLPLFIQSKEDEQVNSHGLTILGYWRFQNKIEDKPDQDYISNYVNVSQD